MYADAKPKTSHCSSMRAAGTQHASRSNHYRNPCKNPTRKGRPTLRQVTRDSEPAGQKAQSAFVVVCSRSTGPWCPCQLALIPRTVAATAADRRENKSRLGARPRPGQLAGECQAARRSSERRSSRRHPPTPTADRGLGSERTPGKARRGTTDGEAGYN